MPRPSCVDSVAGSRRHMAVTAEKGELHCRFLAPKSWTLTTLASDVTRGASLHYSPSCALICQWAEIPPQEKPAPPLCKWGGRPQQPLPVICHLICHLLVRPQPRLHWDYCSSGLNSRERGLNAPQDAREGLILTSEKETFKRPHSPQECHHNRSSWANISWQWDRFHKIHNQLCTALTAVTFTDWNKPHTEEMLHRNTVQGRPRSRDGCGSPLTKC